MPGIDDPLNPRTVVTWYRLQLPRQQATANQSSPRYLYIPRWKTDGQLAVYVSGRLVYGSNGNLLWNGSNHPLWITLHETQSAALADSILLRIERLRASGAAVSSVRLGRQDEIGWRYRMRDMLQIQLPLIVSAAFLAVGLFALFVWLRQKLASREPDSLYLLFFAMSLASFIRSLHFYAGQFKLPVPDQWFGWLTISSLFWLIAASHFLLVRLHRRPQPWLSRAVIGSPISPIIARQILTRFRSGAAAFRPPLEVCAPMPLPSPVSGDQAMLSSRELEVLQLITRGFTADEIARLIQVSPHTVQTYVRRIYSKLKVRSKAEAIYEARHHGLLSD